MGDWPGGWAGGGGEGGRRGGTESGVGGQAVEAEAAPGHLPTPPPSSPRPADPAPQTHRSTPPPPYLNGHRMTLHHREQANDTRSHLIRMGARGILDMRPWQTARPARTAADYR